MSCAWVREAARDRAEAEAHARQCPECAAWLEAGRSLDAVLREMAVEPMTTGPSRAVEIAVMKEFARRGRRRWLTWAVPAAAAAMLVAGVFWPREPKLPPPAEVTETVSSFIPVRYGAPVRPRETLQVMRMDLPRAELLRLGLPVGPENAHGMVKADVLLGEDGLVKGIRFVYGSQRLETKGVIR